MNWEAVGVIGVVVAVLGVILLLPGLWLGRRLARKEKEKKTPLAFHITRVGFIVYGAMVLLMLMGLSVPHVIKHLGINHPWSMPAGFTAYYVLVFYSIWRVERALLRRGIHTAVRMPDV